MGMDLYYISPWTVPQSYVQSYAWWASCGQRKTSAALHPFESVILGTVVHFIHFTFLCHVLWGKPAVQCIILEIFECGWYVTEVQRVATCIGRMLGNRGMRQARTLCSWEAVQTCWGNRSMLDRRMKTECKRYIAFGAHNKAVTEIAASC